MPPKRCPDALADRLQGLEPVARAWRHGARCTRSRSDRRPRRRRLPPRATVTVAVMSVPHRSRREISVVMVPIVRLRAPCAWPARGGAWRSCSRIKPARPASLRGCAFPRPAASPRHPLFGSPHHECERGFERTRRMLGHQGRRPGQRRSARGDDPVPSETVSPAAAHTPD